MTEEIKVQEQTPLIPPVRVFVYDGKEIEDPNPSMSPDQVRMFYTSFFPELATAEVIRRVEPTREIIEFKRKVGTKGEEKIQKILTEKKAQALWDSMDENEKAGVRFGLFPFEKMTSAEQEGYIGRELAVALMSCAKRNGGMIM